MILLLIQVKICLLNDSIDKYFEVDYKEFR